VTGSLVVEVRREPFDGPVAAPLLTALDAELDQRYAGEGIPPPSHDPGDYVPPRGLFVVAYLDGEPVGCGGVKPGPEAGTGEVKRMYVAPRARGRRIAQRVLEELEGWARGAGLHRLVLETGTEQPEAVRLYERLGWTPTAPFGHYAESPLSRHYGLDLT
jgi:GNAT superfamily N-acetyltransferase